MNPQGPLIVQSDRTLLLDVHNPDAEKCRADLIRFATLVKSPEHVHTYRIDSISLWNAVSMGMSAKEILDMLEAWSRFPVPDSVAFTVGDIAGRWGKAFLTEADGAIRLTVTDPVIRAAVLHHRETMRILTQQEDGSFLLEKYNRGEIKLLMTKLGYPVDDRIPLLKGEPVEMAIRKSGSFHLRPYQLEASRALLGDGRSGSGFGVLVLPCGSGKTIVGMQIMASLKTRTLVLTTNIAAVHQWMREISEKMAIAPALVGEYTGEKKEIKPVTVSTYQVLTWRADRGDPFTHLDLLASGNWGLVIYDEVHMLPAPVFKVTAALQAVHRVGLTATLVREDGRQEEVFSLVGPKCYDAPWDVLASGGFIAQAFCHEIRIPLPVDQEVPYAIADKREKYRIASENPAKYEVVRQLIAQHEGDYILVIGQYLDQLEEIGRLTGFPIITGRTANARREELYQQFRSGAIHVLIVSKVANFAIDLPDASVAIQVSGTFGSRSEEAQRLGRILRPKRQNSHFYTLVSRYTSEEDFSQNRQKFLAEQGYTYDIEIWGSS